MAPSSPACWRWDRPSCVVTIAIVDHAVNTANKLAERCWRHRIMARTAAFSSDLSLRCYTFFKGITLGENFRESIRWKGQCPFALVQHAEKFWNIFFQTFRAGMLFFSVHHWRKASQLETFGRKYSRTFQCAVPNGHWPFHLIPPYFSALRQLALVNQMTISPLQRKHLQTPASLFLAWRFDLYPKFFLKESFDSKFEEEVSACLCASHSAPGNKRFRHVIRAKPHSVQNLVDVFVQKDVRKRASTTHAFVRFVFI